MKFNGDEKPDDFVKHNNDEKLNKDVDEKLNQDEKPASPEETADTPVVVLKMKTQLVWLLLIYSVPTHRLDWFVKARVQAEANSELCNTKWSANTITEKSFR